MDPSRTPNPIGIIEMAPKKNAVEFATTAWQRDISLEKKLVSKTRVMPPSS